MTEREDYEADPQGWIERNAVNGIRPHIPPRTGEERLLLQLYSLPLPDWCGKGQACGTCWVCRLMNDGSDPEQ